MDKLNPHLPVFLIDTNPDDDTGTNFIALTDDPANMTQWVFMGNQAHKKKLVEFKINNEEKQIITGVVSRPGQTIYRNAIEGDVGDHYITETPESIYKDMMKFSKRNAHANVNINHKKDQKVKDVFVFESWIVGQVDKIHSILNDNTIEPGSWAVTMKVDNPEVWQMVKSGEIVGFSLEGMFNYKPVQKSVELSKEELLYNSIKKIIQEI